MPVDANATKKAQLKNPEVLKALLESSIEMQYIHAMLRFKVIAKIDTTLEGQPGDRINVIAYNYLGAAKDVAEGADITIDKLQAIEKISPVIKKVGKGVEITDEAVLTAYGDPVGEAQKQIQLAIRDKLDQDILDTLATAPLKYDNKAAIIDYTSILNAAGMFCDEEEDQYILFIHPNQKIDLMADAQFEKANLLKDEMLTEGAIGRIAGCDVIVSRRVPIDTSGADPVINNFICKKEAVQILTKRGVVVETDRNIKAQSNMVVATSHYVTWLLFGDKVVQMQNKQGFKAAVPTHFDAPDVTPRP